MKPWRDLKSIAIPECMQHLPIDARGYPIPFSVTMRHDGIPDFRVIDEATWGNCVVYRLCAITGKPLGDEIAFVGGPKSIVSRCFTDAGMLPAAAEYALQVCPFLAAPKFGYAKHESEIPGVRLVVNDAVSTERPDRFGMGITNSYRLLQIQGVTIIEASLFKSVKFWKEGQPINALGAI